MNQNKNQLTTTTGTGVVLRNASKSLKITNKLLAEVDDFDKHWDWWLSLSDEWKRFNLERFLNIYAYSYPQNVCGASQDAFISHLKEIDFRWNDKNCMRENLLTICNSAN